MAQRMTKRVRVALPLALMLAMSLRAEQADRDRGGRYEARYDDGSVLLLIWPALGGSGALPAIPYGSAHFHSRTPFDGDVTLYRIGWDPDEGGSEDLIWEALATLAGQSLRPEAL